MAVRDVREIVALMSLVNAVWYFLIGFVVLVVRGISENEHVIELKNKRVLVVGLGKSGIAAARFLKARGAQVTVSDIRPAGLISELPALLDAGIMVETGSHGLLTFRRQDLIVVSPGVPSNTPELTTVRAMGIPIIGEMELGAEFLQGQIIAITGSNGKTTTTTLIGEILKASGKATLVEATSAVRSSIWSRNPLRRAGVCSRSRASSWRRFKHSIRRSRWC